MPRKKRKTVGRKQKPSSQKQGSSSTKAQADTTTTPPTTKKRKIATNEKTPAVFVSPAKTNQTRRSTRVTSTAKTSSSISISKGDVIVQLFIYLDELDESLLKNSITMIRQRLESADKDLIQLKSRVKMK